MNTRILASRVGLTLAIALAPEAVEATECLDTLSQTGMNICTYQAFRRTDAELNSVYQQIINRLRTDVGTARYMTMAQRAWTAFRDAECDLVASGTTGGSIQPTISSTCLESMTQLRIKTLRGYLDCDGNDLSCPIRRQ